MEPTKNPEPQVCDDYEPGHECPQCAEALDHQMRQFERAYGHLVKRELANERHERETFGRVLTDAERLHDAGRRWNPF